MNKTLALFKLRSLLKKFETEAERAENFLEVLH